MQTPRMLSTPGRAAPALVDAGVGVGVAVLGLAAGAAGVGPPWISGPRPLDVVAVGLVGVVAGALALRRRYPMAVLVVLNAVALAWAAGRYPGPLVMLAPLIACYTLAAQRVNGFPSVCLGQNAKKPSYVRRPRSRSVVPKPLPISWAITSSW
jgi:hypothetical protein